MIDDLPSDPFALLAPGTFEPSARRELTLCGAPIELLWLPCRKNRPGVPKAARPAFRRSHVDRILHEEALWSGHGTVLTPNMYPFARQQVVLWADEPRRDPTRAMLEIMFALEERHGGSVLLNSIGAAASITRAHLHLVSDHNDFLHRLERHSWSPKVLDLSAELRAEVEIWRLAEPFPALAIGISGPATPRAQLTHQLLQLRTTPAFNLVASRGVTWILPRSAIEIPTPHFPHALGAAELWGRWCFAEEADFASATPEQLFKALRLGGYPAGLLE